MYIYDIQQPHSKNLSYETNYEFIKILISQYDCA